MFKPVTGVSVKGFTPHATNTSAINIIKDYCIQRNYRCRGCRYSIRYPFDNMCVEYPKEVANNVQTCVFANCPCSWDED